METVVITGGSLMADEMPDYRGNCLFPGLKIGNADYKELIGGKGLRYMTNATKMALVTTGLSKKHARVKEFSQKQCGIVVATNFSSLAALMSYDTTTLTEGPRAVSVMQGPNLVLNATAAMLGIHYNITGFNTTISSGRVASMDALEYACKMIQKQEVNMVIVTGVEEIIKEYNDWLVENKIINRDLAALFRQCSGTVILESESHAAERGAEIYGKILKFSSAFNSNYMINGGSEEDDREEYDYMVNHIVKDCTDIKNICLSDNHQTKRHHYEKQYIKNKFKYAKIISAYHEFGGELMGATGTAQLLHSLSIFDSGKGIIFCNDSTGNFRGLLIEK